MRWLGLRLFLFAFTLLSLFSPTKILEARDETVSRSAGNIECFTLLEKISQIAPKIFRNGKIKIYIIDGKAPIASLLSGWANASDYGLHVDRFESENLKYVKEGYELLLETRATIVKAALFSAVGIFTYAAFQHDPKAALALIPGIGLALQSAKYFRILRRARELYQTALDREKNFSITENEAPAFPSFPRELLAELSSSKWQAHLVQWKADFHHYRLADPEVLSAPIPPPLRVSVLLSESSENREPYLAIITEEF